MQIGDTLFIIPARGGSKGLPYKNILPIKGKPMICYTIDAARGVSNDENICVSTDDLNIKKVVEEYGLGIPFIRPPELGTDSAGSREVLLHAIEYFKEKLNKVFSKICLLQPTSPLRTAKNILEAYQLWNDDLDMVVSVKESKANPYTLYTEDAQGYLVKHKESRITRRQELPKYWQYNGAIYFIKTQSLQHMAIGKFRKVVKYVMSAQDSIDVDNEFDIQVAEIFLR